MSTVLIIAIPVLLILAAVMIIATGRKRATSDPEGRVTGTLSAETRQTDQSVGAADEADDESVGARERADDTRKAIGSGSFGVGAESLGRWPDLVRDHRRLGRSRVVCD